MPTSDRRSSRFMSTFAPSTSRQDAAAVDSAPSSFSSSYLPDPAALLKDLAPSLLASSSRILHPHNLTAHQQSLSSSSSNSSHSRGGTDLSTIETLRRKLSFLRTGLESNPAMGWGPLSQELYIRDRVDDLLRLPVPAAPFSFTSTSATTTNNSIGLLEAPRPKSDATVPLIQGFQATIPTANRAKAERRQRRAAVSERRLGLSNGTKLGLKQRGERARGMLLDQVPEHDDSTTTQPPQSKLISNGDPEVEMPTRIDLERDLQAIAQDMNHVAVKRALVNSQIRDVEDKIRQLETVRDGFRKNLLNLREDELELEDEMQGIEAALSRLPLIPTDLSSPRSTASASTTTIIPNGTTTSTSSTLLSAPSSRRRKGPAFLPSEHDDLPTSVAFMTLHGHLSPITSLDFSSPYQTLVTSSLDSSVRMWDLTTGEPTGFLKGHDGIVKVLQVEESGVCVTGGKDGRLKVWNLERAKEEFVAHSSNLGDSLSSASVPAAVEEDVFGSKPIEEDGLLREEGYTSSSSIRQGGLAAGDAKSDEPKGACMRTMEGHTKSVTSLYFDGPTLLTGSSDSTLRQWDLNTGQCILTMDILWALSNPNPASSTHYPASSYSNSTVDPFAQSFSTSSGYSSSPSSHPYHGASSPPTTPRKTFSSLRRQSSLFDSSPGAMNVNSALMDRTYYADGSWEPYEDFVGGIQFWGYALASGTRDGCVRMWDMRTGQAHRTLVGHTGPVTSVQFDEYHLVSGSLDKSIRIWDLRTGSISDTIKYDYPITALQFDNRKIVSAAGENGVKVYNRTTLEHSTLSINGHTAPVEKLRFMDKYLATGSRDCTVKIWALP
ncbi:WD40 repeat domain-containing protein [Sporobolomyces koalae]|uniref:WD40 repeat domain-containing protein n=1 Tax=Sporobolomyces koalae TaxID=500713 RepID=UPI003172F5E9